MGACGVLNVGNYKFQKGTGIPQGLKLGLGAHNYCCLHVGDSICILMSALALERSCMDGSKCIPHPSAVLRALAAPSYRGSISLCFMHNCTCAWLQQAVERVVVLWSECTATLCITS